MSYNQQQLNAAIAAAVSAALGQAQGAAAGGGAAPNPRGGGQRGGRRAGNRGGRQGRAGRGGGGNPQAGSTAPGQSTSLMARLHINSPELLSFVGITSARLLDAHAGLLDGLVKSHAEYKRFVVDLYRATHTGYTGLVREVEGALRSGMVNGTTDTEVFANASMLIVLIVLRLWNVAMQGTLAQAPVALTSGGVNTGATATADAQRLTTWFDAELTLPFNQHEVAALERAKAVTGVERARIPAESRHAFADMDQVRRHSRDSANQAGIPMGEPARQVVTFHARPRAVLDLSQYRIQTSLQTMTAGGAALF